MFQESNKSSREEINVEKDIFEVLKCATTMGEGLEETLQGLKQHFCPMHLQQLLLVTMRKKNMLKRES
jgi:hypothetical protein